MKTKKMIAGITSFPEYQYAAAQGRCLDDESEADVVRWQNKEFAVRMCRIRHCNTALKYDGIVKIYPGTPQARSAYVYRCPKCGNAEMFRSVSPRKRNA